MVSSFPLLLICAAGLLLRVRVVAGDANRDLFAAIETQARGSAKSLPLLWWFLECWTADFSDQGVPKSAVQRSKN